MKKGLIFSISILGTLAVWAQPRTGLKVDSVMVVNTYKPNLLDPTKMIFKPSLPEIEKEKPVFKYTRIERYLSPKFKPEFKAPSSFRGVTDLKTPKNTLLAGFGSTINPVFGYDGGFSAKSNLLLVHVGHQSAFGKLNLADSTLYPHYSDSRIRLEDQFQSAAFGGKVGVDFDHRWNRRYGWATDSLVRDSLSNSYRQFGFDGEVAGKSELLPWNAGVRYQNLVDQIGASEGMLQLYASASPVILSAFSTKIDVSFQTVGLNPNSLVIPQFNRNVVEITPSIQKKTDKAQLDAALGIVTERYSGLTDSTKLHLFPRFSVGYQLDENTQAKVIFNSGLQWNTYAQMSKINPFMSTPSLLLNTTERWNLGISGNHTLESGWMISAKASAGAYQNMPFYVSNPQQMESTFQVAFDSLTKVQKLEGTLQKKFDGQWEMSMGCLLQNLKTTSLDAAYYTPRVKLDLNVKYALQPKTKVGLEAHVWGIRTFAGGQKTVSTLPWVPDLTLTMDHEWKKGLSFFGRLQNMAFTNYALYFGVPAYGPNVLMGIRWNH
jgi:hypothetical protein